jgi:hypothetical protein
MFGYNFWQPKTKDLNTMTRMDELHKKIQTGIDRIDRIKENPDYPVHPC